MIRGARQFRFPWLPYVFADILALVLAYYATILLRFRSDLGRRLYDWVTIVILEHPAGEADEVLESFYYTSAFRIIVILAVVLFTLYALRHLYAGKRFILRFPTAWNVVVCNLIALALFYFYWYLTRNVFHPRSLFGTLIVLNIVLCPLLRSLMDAMLALMRKKWGIDRIAALLVGNGDAADLLHDVLVNIEPQGIYCATRYSFAEDQPLSDELERVRTTMEASAIGMLIVADTTLSVPQIMQVLELAAEMGVPAKILSPHLEVLVTDAKLPCDMLEGVPLVHFNAPQHNHVLMRLRKGMTFVCAALFVLLGSPVILVLAVLIRLTSEGPAIFRQKRIGVNRKPFYIYKFRTMRHMAEEELESLETENQSAGALFKIRRDPRITSIGRFLRRFSLDELPQLFNVLRGDMAIVGPRPLPERDFEKYEEDWHYIRHGGLPGLTCLWQISGRSNLNFHEMCILDIYYLRNHTWIMDLSIVLQTARTVLFGVGAY